jgi:tyramine---L-glutamate ligase
LEVLTFPTAARVDNPMMTFAQLAQAADWTLLIAPESGGQLQALAGMFRGFGRLLGPSPQAVVATSDKVLLGNLWAKNGVPTPRIYFSNDEWSMAGRPSRDRSPLPESIRYPAVCKPVDGCGSEGVQLVRSADELAAVPRLHNRLIQEFVPGRAASVSFLAGPNQVVPLLPTFQLLSTDGRFRYLGGTLPIMPEYAERAVTLGRQAIACVPGLFGYVGVDLVLGERDMAIEINPRLTTSYVGLRAAAETNLAGAMLDVCEGRHVDVKWKPGAVNFAADGTVS